MGRLLWPRGKRNVWHCYFKPSSSYHFPTRWHVRTYGLFAANPFGEKDFPGGKKEASPQILSAGKSLSLKYRVIFHRGDAEAAQVAAAFETYSCTQK